MKVIEQFLKSKTNIESECEDSIFISKNFAAVIDGVTSKSTRKYMNETSGRVCSQLIKKVLEDLPAKSSANQAVQFLTSAVFAFYKEQGIEELVMNFPNERVSACIAIYSNHKNEIWMVGDCQCFVGNYRYSNTKRIEISLSRIRSFFIQSELSLGKSLDTMQANDSGREFIMPILERQSLFQNALEDTDYCYGVIDGFKVPKTQIVVIKVSKFSEQTNIILATDGYPEIFSKLAQSEKYLNKILRDDPLCFKNHLSTKGVIPGNASFDDRAFLNIKLETKVI